MTPSAENKPVAIAARSLERAKAFAEVFDIPRAYGSYEDLANDDGIDVVYVGTIHPEHKRVASIFLRKGIPVLCEKPLTMNVKDTQEMVALAREKGVFLMEGFWSRFFPAYGTLRDLIDSGAVGNVHTVEASFEVPIGHVPRIKEKALGGSALLDLGCYCLQFALWIFREKHEKMEVSGELFDTGVDKSCRIDLQYPGGKRAILSCHGDFDGKTSACVIGDKGRIDIPSHFWSATKMTLPDGSTRTDSLDFISKREFNFVNSAGFLYEIEHVHRCLSQGLIESPLMPLDETLYMKEIHDAILALLGVTYD